MSGAFLNLDFVVRHVSRKDNAFPMDQALGKAYNKPAKSSASITGFTRRKEIVCKWNLIKDDKEKCWNFINSICQMNDDSKASTMNFQVRLPK